MNNKYKIQLISKSEYDKLYLLTEPKANQILNCTQAPFYNIETIEIIYLKVLIDDKPVAITIINTYKLIFPFLKIYRINRGPHYLVNNSTSTKEIIFNNIFYFLKSQGYKLLIISPNISSSNLVKILPRLKIKLPLKNWESSIITLCDNPNSQIKKFKSKWRNTLKKGIKHVSIDQVTSQIEFLKIISEYNKYGNSLSFKTIPTKSLQLWNSNNTENAKQFPYLKVYKSYLPQSPYETIAAIGILTFLNTSLYLFGYTSKKGKFYHANSVLLWYSIKQSIIRKENHFDLGGLSQATPKGIRKFKEALNGLPYSIPGEFLCILNFME